MDEMLIKLYALKIYGEVGPRTLQTLLIRFGSLDEILNAEVDDLEGIPRVSEKRAHKIIESGNRLRDAEEEIKLARDAGIGIVSIFDNNFPAPLLKIDDPPPMMFYRGKLPSDGNPAIAVVGTTKAGEEGIAASVKIGKMLAEKGISVISGMAAGIDASAHLGSLKNGGYTVGVLGSGLLHVYPRENLALSRMVEKSGCLMSEFHPEMRVSVGRLMSRNRIIVGLASAIIVVEISEKSGGTLNAVIRASEQGKGCYLYDPGKNVSSQYQAEHGVVCFNSIGQLEPMIEYMTVDND